MPECLHIWLIDDDENEEFFVRRAFQHSGRKVQMRALPRAELARAALETAREEPLPHVILCDLKMPGMDGLEFLRWLRQSPWRALPVVMRSNSGLGRDVTRAYELGANAYHMKAPTLEGLQETIGAFAEFWRSVALPKVC